MAEKNLDIEMYGAIKELGAKLEASDRSRTEFQTRLENKVDEFGRQLKEVHDRQDSLAKTQEKHSEDIAELQGWKKHIEPTVEKADMMFTIYFYVKKHWIKVLILSFLIYVFPVMTWVLWVVNSHAIDVPFFARISAFFIDPYINKYLGDAAYHNYLYESAIQ